MAPRRQLAARPPKSSRDQLIEKHLGLVHHVAGQLSRALSVRSSFDELVSSGTLGLIGAIDTFDRARGLAFSTFAAPRIRGAILDDLRRQDHVPRSLRRKSREIARARERLMAEHGRPAMPREVAASLDVDLETLWEWENDLQATNHVSMHATDGFDDESGTAPEFSIRDEAEGVDDVLDREMEVQRMRDAILELKQQERTVLTLYYFEHLKLREIAEVLKLTESRVSQVRTRALARLREAMQVAVAA